MTQKPQDNAPVILRVKNITVKPLDQYNGQEATIVHSFNIGREIFASVLCSDGQTLLLDPDQYEVISGTLTPAPPDRSQNHHRAQDLRMAKAARRHANRTFRRGGTVQY